MVKYRTEIDGLRAFAVFPVIINHAFPNLMPGGFVGVDIFFVISGYLITCILIAEITQEKFSIFGFYERRARRILPALSVVVIFSTFMSWQLMTNSQFRDFFDSVSGTALFYSNFVFWFQVDYFDTDALQKPLLHMWSLAIEEQFYILFPFLLLVSWKRLREKLWVPVLCLAVLSLLLSIQFSPDYPSASFYLLHTRFWELAIGALVAIGFKGSELRGGDFFGLTGLLLIIFSITFIDADLVFPGAIALVPTLGAAFVLVGARDGNFSARFLSFKPFVWLGLISYSAYLWHNPLLVFGRRYFLHELPVDVTLLIVVLSIFLAFLSWRYVEQPFRNRSFLRRQAILSVSLVILTLGAVLPNVALLKDWGMQRTTSAGHTTDWLDELRKPNYGLGKNCEADEDFSIADCSTYAIPKYILWGDSYAMHLAQGMVAGKLEFTQITKSACAPIFKIAPYSSKYNLAWGEKCIAHNDKALDIIINSPADRIVISSPFGSLRSGSFELNINGSLEPNIENKAINMLVSTLDILKKNGKQVLIISAMPSPPFNAADCMTASSFIGSTFESCNFARELDNRKQDYEILEVVSKLSGTPVLYLRDFVCDQKICHVEINGIPLYRDPSHISPSGSTAIGALTDFPNALKRVFQLHAYDGRAAD